jgi:hypothetical protein
VIVNGRTMNPPHSRTRRDDRSHGDSSPTVRVGCVDRMGAICPRCGRPYFLERVGDPGVCCICDRDIAGLGLA